MATSVHWHWHSVSTLTVLTQYGYGPYSNSIFHEHYHSKRHSLKLERVHPNSNILERVHPYSNMTFKKGLFWNSNGLTPIHFAAIHGFLYVLALKIDFADLIFCGSTGAGALRNTHKIVTQCQYGWAPKNSGFQCTLMATVMWLLTNWKKGWIYVTLSN